MKQRYLYVLVAGSFLCLQTMKADEVNVNKNDTIKTYNIDEVIITSSTKETNEAAFVAGICIYPFPGKLFQ